jgi:Fe-S oxidoreductase/nitrate reductase gamma subunit
MEAFREILWNVPGGPWAIYPVALVVAIVFLYAGFVRFLDVWRRGKPEDRFHPFWSRIGNFIKLGVVEGLIHRKFLREFYPGISHLFIFWGCIILLLGAGIDFVGHYWFHSWVHGAPFLAESLINDIGGLLVFTGTIIFIIRRYAQKPGAFQERLDRSADDLIAVSLILAVVITGFFVEALRIAAVEPGTEATWSLWSPFGLVISEAFTGLSSGTNLVLHQVLWFLHLILAVGAVVYISLFYNKLAHIIVAPANVFFRSREPKGALQPIDLEEAETFGVGKIEDFTWKQLLDLDACTRCGRCQEVCPAYISGQPLSPKKLIQSMKEHLLEESKYPLKVRVPKTSLLIPEADPPRSLIGEVIPEDAIWSCCACRACQEACPVYVEHINKIIDMRRSLILEQAKVPELAEPILTSIEARGHVVIGTTHTRTDWEEGLEVKHLSEDSAVDLVFWVGCQASLEDRSMKIAQAFGKVLKAANVNFATLGTEETCCGDPARRMGNEYLFQMQATKNIELLKSYGVNKIVTTCPHCFNTIKNEYPQFGGEFEVIHHSQLITQLIKEGRLKLTSRLNHRITYHDPCYLGRHNDIYDPPREVLAAITKGALVEMERNHWNSFCCGGGGGRFWVEEKQGKRISDVRIEDVIKTNAEIVATACPYCMQMLEDSIKSKDAEESLKDLDIAELVAEAIE